MPAIIPVNNQGNRRIEFNTGDGVYLFRTYYTQGQQDGWFLDISDRHGNALITGKRITPGCPNILKGHGDKFRDVQLAVVVISGDETRPDALGNGTYLFWYGKGEQNDFVVGDPLIDIPADEWSFSGVDMSDDHSKLKNRFIPDQHDIPAITGLAEALNGKIGPAALNEYAPLASPSFSGAPKTPTPPASAAGEEITNAAFVLRAIQGSGSGTYAPLDSPHFTGSPTGPTPPTGDSSDRLATTSHVKAQGFAPVESPTFTGTPKTPTPPTTASGDEIANADFVQGRLATKADLVGGRVPLEQLPVEVIAQTFSVATTADLVTLTGARPGDFARITSGADAGKVYTLAGDDPTVLASWIDITNDGGVISVNGLEGVVTIDLATLPDVAAALGAKAPLDSPALTGSPTSTTPAAGDNSNRIATTAHVKAQGFAPLASPALTGTPTTPTPAAGTNTKQIINAEFVQAAIAAIKPVNYTTAEQDTKITWIDGKKIYQKTINTGALINSGNKTVAHGIASFATLVQAYGWASEGTHYIVLPWPVSPTGIFADAVNVTISCGAYMSAYWSSSVTIFYTCTNR